MKSTWTIRRHAWLAGGRLPAAILTLALTGMAATGLAHVNPWPATGTALAIKKVGSLELHPCKVAAGREEARVYCGRVMRPLDPTGDTPGNLSIYFEFYPHSIPGRSVGTLVATEGGPGYPATGSRDEYLALFAPLRADRDVLIMDNRGTGGSAPIDCHALQTADAWTVESVAACGESLGVRAPLFSTAYAADDLAAILDALEVGKIDLYGDSYGTYFEQVFATRHPEALRSIVLDGAYPMTGADYAWYPSYGPAMRAKFNIACERSPGCASIPGSSIDHITPALQALRSHPFDARAHDVNGRERIFRAGASQLAIVMYGSAPAGTSARETDAAARAFARGDSLPLLRLMAETAAAVDSRDPTADAAKWSAGLAAAVMCQDPPQIFDMKLPPPERAADRDRALQARELAHPDTYAPFTIDEYRAMPLDYSFLDQCVAWPVSTAPHAASQVGMGAIYPDIPALIVSGELDNITTLADGAAVAAAFPQGLQIRIANSFHVNALPHARSPCAAQIVRRFMMTTTTGDTSCAAQVPPLRLVTQFALKAADLEPVVALQGNAAAPAQLRLVMAALMSAQDVLARVHSNESGRGTGLRGGTFRVEPSTDTRLTRIRLSAIRWTQDVAVSGRIDKTNAPAGIVAASLRVVAADGTLGEVRIRYSDGLEPEAHIEGNIGGKTILASSPAL